MAIATSTLSASTTESQVSSPSYPSLPILAVSPTTDASFHPLPSRSYSTSRLTPLNESLEIVYWILTLSVCSPIISTKLITGTMLSRTNEIVSALPVSLSAGVSLKKTSPAKSGRSTKVRQLIYVVSTLSVTVLIRGCSISWSSLTITVLPSDCLLD